MVGKQMIIIINNYKYTIKVVNKYFEIFICVFIHIFAFNKKERVKNQIH